MGGGQDGCERRIKVFVKIQKKSFLFWGGWGWGGGGARVDVNREVKFLFVKIPKKKWGWCSGGGSLGGCEHIFKISPNTSLIILFQQTQVSSCHL